MFTARRRENSRFRGRFKFVFELGTIRRAAPKKRSFKQRRSRRRRHLPRWDENHRAPVDFSVIGEFLSCTHERTVSNHFQPITTQESREVKEHGTHSECVTTQKNAKTTKRSSTVKINDRW